MNESKFLNDFGDALKSARIHRQLSQEALAELLEVDRTYISLLESGKRNPSLVLIGKIASALEIEPSAIVPDCRGELDD